MEEANLDPLFKGSTPETIVQSDEGFWVSLGFPKLPPSFWQPTAMRHVLATIETFGLNPDRLMIEFTESAFVFDGRRSMEFVLEELHERGLRLEALAGVGLARAL